MKILNDLSAHKLNEKLILSDDRIDVDFITGRVEIISNHQFEVRYLSQEELSAIKNKLVNVEKFDSENEIEVRLDPGTIITIISIILTLIGIVQSIIGYVNGGKCKKILVEETHEEVTEYSNGTVKRRTFKTKRVEIEC